MSSASVDAAHTGAKGLRVVDQDAVTGSNLISETLPAEPGRSYKLSFQAMAMADSTGCGVFLWFRDAEGKPLPDPEAEVIPAEATDWTEFSKEFVAPSDAAGVAVWVHSFSTNQGEWMIDDIKVEEIGTPEGKPAAAAKLAPAPVAAAPKLTAPGAPPSLPNPLVPVVLKVDDLTSRGEIPARWKRIVDFAKEKQVKLSIGIIANSLEGDKPAYFTWLKELQASGMVELWFHGYTHGVREVDGKQYAEFSLRTYEEQKEFFTKSQELARTRLGAPFTVYGPPGGGNVPPSAADLDATVRVMAEDPDMRLWLYPIAMDERGRQLEAAGKVRILDRVYQVNIEQPLFVPSSEKFIAAYSRFAKGRKYFIMQGHPNQWDDARWLEFTKIVDYLKENHIPVLTPSELAAQLEKSS